MSLDDGTSSLGDVLGSPGAAEYARGAIMAAGAASGASGASVLGQLRSYGLGIRTQSFYQTYNALQARYAANASASSLSVDSTTGLFAAGNPPENWTGQYVHQVTATFRTRDDQGNYMLSQRTLGVKSATVLTPYDASQAALSVINTPVEDDDQGRYGGAGDLLGLTLTGAWYDTRPTLLRGI